MKRLLFLVFCLLVGELLFSQTIPEKFWKSNLADSFFFFGNNIPYQVGTVFRDQPFKKAEQLDGSFLTCKLVNREFSGNDVFITIDMVSGRNRLGRIIWQLRYLAPKKLVMIQSIETINPAGVHAKLEINQNWTGDMFQQYYSSIAQMLSLYFDLDDLQKKAEALAPSPAPTPQPSPRAPEAPVSSSLRTIPPDEK